MAQQEQLVAQKQEELSQALLTQQAKLEEIGGYQQRKLTRSSSSVPALRGS